MSAFEEDFRYAVNNGGGGRRKRHPNLSFSRTPGCACMIMYRYE